jgi:hypothetical protein
MPRGERAINAQNGPLLRKGGFSGGLSVLRRWTICLENKTDASRKEYADGIKVIGGDSCGTG